MVTEEKHQGGEAGDSCDQKPQIRAENSSQSLRGLDQISDLSSRCSTIRTRSTRRLEKQAKRRLVYKSGECNLSRANIRKKNQRYIADIFTTLVDMKWRWNLLIFVSAFFLSWLIFAVIWWLVCYINGDMHQKGQQAHTACVDEVYDFLTALLFSIETMTTIGYGGRATTPHCPQAILLMMVQSCWGVTIHTLMTGIVFAKLCRPKNRAETLMFSKNAVICKRNGFLTLLLRVGDMRKSQIIDANVRAVLLKKRVTVEGEVIPMDHHRLQLGDAEADGRLLLVWPVILEHRIDETSPLWDTSAEDLSQEQFEVIVILEGIVESTGMATQARTSYLPGEILWGHRFDTLASFQKYNGEYMIDYSRFHTTIPINTPTCSARELMDMYKYDKNCYNIDYPQLFG